MPKHIHPKTAHLPPNEVIVQMYQDEMTAPQIAEELKTTRHVILRRLKEAGIAIRTNSEAQKLTYQKGRNVTRYWSGREIPPELIEKRAAGIRGENHYLWKGGKDKRDYRKNVTKELCLTCGATENLGIHHKDLDHYNNEPENLEVLCVSCHMRLHKNLYWQAKREGKPTPKSNGKIGWLRQASA